MSPDLNDPSSTKSVNVEMAPIVVTTIDRGNGTGNGQVLQTASGLPNFVVKGVQPLVMILVRAVRVFLQTLIGLVTTGLASPTALPAKDFAHLLLLCASLSLAPAVICIIQNAIELLGKIDQSHPTLAG